MKQNKNYEKTYEFNNRQFLNSVHIEPYTGTINPGKIALSEDRIKKLEAGMQVWPELIPSFTELVDYVIFADDDENGAWNTRYGCSCGHFWFNEPHVKGQIGIYAAPLGTLGGLEALAHEVGHLRLRMVGIQIEDHDNQILLNGPDELFNSPIRKDKLRPMSAVLQAQYSYVMVSQMDLKYFDAFPDDPKKQQCAIDYLRINIPRISKGHDEVNNNIKMTENGKQFMDGFWRFSDNVINRGLSMI